MINPPTCHCHPLSLDTGSQINDFIKKEQELGTGYVTATDHGSMGSAYLIYTKAQKASLTPILGIEVYLRDLECDLLKKMTASPEDYLKFGNPKSKYMHATLHYMDLEAYETGCSVLSKAPREKHGSEEKPIYTWDDIATLGSKNVTGGSGCLIGVVQRHLLVGRPDVAEAYYVKYKNLFKKGNFFVEVFPHKCTHNWVSGVFVTVKDSGGNTKQLRFYEEKKLKTNKAEEISASGLARSPAKHTHLLGIKNYRTWEDVSYEIVSVRHVEEFVQNECTVDAPDGDLQARANKFVLQMAEKYGDPVISSDDSHYVNPEDKIVQDVALAQSGNWRFFGSYHRQSGSEQLDCYKETLGLSDKDFEKWTNNALEWASKFKGFEFNYQPSLANKFYPSDTLGHLMSLIQKHGRMKDDPEYTKRLETEIQMLHKNGKIDLLPYFFPAEEVCEEYAINGELAGIGRGSAAGLLVSYYLGVTHLDPIKEGLSMERFISLDRILGGKLPDIDQDLSSTDYLVGTTVDRVTVEMEDGTIREYSSEDVVQTEEGPMSIFEAATKKLDILDLEEADE